MLNNVVVNRNNLRNKKKMRIKKKIFPLNKNCLCIFKSNKNFYLQIIGTDNKIFLSSSNFELLKSYSLNKNNYKQELIKILSKNMACKLLKNGINTITFYRNGYSYSGNIKKIVDYIRSYGIKI